MTTAIQEIPFTPPVAGSDALPRTLSTLAYRCTPLPEGRLLAILGGCAELTGYTPEELLAEVEISLASIVHPADKSLWNDTSHTEFSHLVYDFRIICRQGQLKWVKQTASGVYDSSGKLLHIEGIIFENPEAKNTSLLSNAFISYQNAINSGSIVSITDTKGRIIFANDLFCHHSQYSRKELLGKAHRIINSGYHSKAFFANLWETITKGNIWRGEIKNKARDGSFYWVDTVISPVHDNEGNIIQFLSIRNVITASKQQEEKLVNAVNFNNQIIQSSDHVFYRIQIAEDDSRAAKLTYISPQSLQFYGKSPEKMIGCGSFWTDFTHPEDIPTVKENIDCLFAKKEGRTFSYRIFNCQKQDYLWVETFSCPSIDAQGHIREIYGSVRDVSKNKEYEEKLQYKRWFLSEGQRLSQTGSWHINMKTGELLWSEETYRIFGVEKGTPLSNDRFLSFVHPDDREFVKNAWQKALEGKVYDLEHRIVVNGKTKWVRQRARVEFDETNSVLNGFGGVQDITILKEREIEQQKLVEELSARNNELMQFNYIVSHNLRSHTARILGLSGVLNSGRRHSESEVAKVIELIGKSAEDLDGLIQDLNLILSSRAPLNEKKESVLMMDVLSTISASLESQIKATGTIIHLHIDDNASSITTIKSFLESIFYNLISNAIKYRAEGRRPEIRIEVKRSSAETEITVADNGQGIDLARYGENIFGLYKRFNLSVEGKGLGLHMTKTQIEALGGKITVASELNTGTTFSIRLPH